MTYLMYGVRKQSNFTTTVVYSCSNTICFEDYSLSWIELSWSPERNHVSDVLFLDSKILNIIYNHFLSIFRIKVFKHFLLI